MIRTRTPFRITLGGGGTDLASYYEQHGGMCLAAAVSLNLDILLKPAWEQDDILAHYSESERVQSLEELKNERLRECLRYAGITKRIEVASFASVGPKTGLGSSSSFVVGLLKSLYAIQNIHIDKEELARAACEVEVNILKKPMGKQDQYAAAFGGMQMFTFDPNGDVRVEHISMPRTKRQELDERLLLFWTGVSRDSESVLKDQVVRSEEMDQDMMENLHRVKELGFDSKAALHKGDLERFGQLMHTHWENKIKRSPNMTTESISKWYNTGMANGAVGGKLVGAGGGGFLMFLADDSEKLRLAMKQEGLQEISFNFDSEGSRVVEDDRNHKVEVVGIQDGVKMKELQWP
ncbi:MAG: galactokinase [Candidatus Woesearchaeota archaeon]|nr:galactokinase [Candidatus Woesearchaeota archaeon]MDP7198374.1 galactokinase [Candidatus Woesearchaeota archaeon]MDP7467476.1 galactokinase [Candidatus Woesearchaeota archaeon]MDP7647703.1 galactokinase [Candidatus Woesearchaeota archaeon]|tara:strand:+ start:306 stop:1355 length:1050 start_codon:yes stop_codon:yes gene_type:complete